MKQVFKANESLRRLLCALLVAIMVIGMIPLSAPKAAAALKAGDMIYLKPSNQWGQSSPRYAAYFFGNGEKWVSMTKLENGYYQVKVPTDKKYPKVIFCRMNPSASTNNWDNKWNQTGDLTIPDDGKTLFTIPDSAWDGSTTTWSKK